VGFGRCRAIAEATSAGAARRSPPGVFGGPGWGESEGRGGARAVCYAGLTA
jgi:hypothetical protein